MLPTLNGNTSVSGATAIVASNKASSPMPGFGASTRQTQDKLYISPEHEKMHFGKLSPGPQSGTYTMPPTVGKQFLSRNKSMPSWGFSTATRFASDKKGLRGSETPGPGAYSVWDETGARPS